MFGVDDLAIAGLVMGGVSSIANFGLGLANYGYQKNLQSDIFRREDTSIARRVHDLKASGLSPVLAAGQGAGTGGIVSTHAPEIDPTIATQIYTQLATMQKDFAVKDQTIKLLQTQQHLNSINAKIKDLDYYYYNETGISPNSSPIAKMMRDLLAFYSKFKSTDTPNIMNEIKKKIPYKGNPYMEHDLTPEGFDKSKPPRG